MSQTQTEVIKVKGINNKAKFGKGSLLTTDGTWVNVGDKSKAEITDFIKGRAYEVEMLTSDTGNKYVLEAKEIGRDNTPLHAEAPVGSLEVKNPLSTVDTYVPRDFNAEARGKTKCALFGNALQSPLMTSVQTVDEGIALAIKLADAGMDYVFPKVD